ncbi:hypothetical protein II906_03220 [bacterium]|nr:hypothetical protein [bacterium]
MIQAPQPQYIPVGPQPVQNVQPMAAQPVQYVPQQAPGYIYNYPQASCYNQPNAGKSQFNGVNIEIINPQANGIPQGCYPQAGYPQNYAPAYPQMPYQQPMPAQFVPVQQPVVIPQYPAQIPSQPVTQVPAAQVPAAQVPAAQIPAAQAPEAQVPAANTPIVGPNQTPVVEQPQVIDPNATVESFKAKLNSQDLDEQGQGIKDVFKAIDTDSPEGSVLLDDEIVDSLLNIINKDTTELEHPSKEVEELRQKPENEMTPEELAKATTQSPFEKAEMNKQMALYALAEVQSTINKKLEGQNSPIFEFKDLPGIETVIESVKSNDNQFIRMSAIEALNHIARPEYKEDLSTIFTIAQQDEDSSVKEAATQALENLNK